MNEQKLIYVEDLEKALYNEPCGESDYGTDNYCPFCGAEMDIEKK